jgi:Holliday junction resolvasome RuvABC endonuclease subunit
MATPKAIDIPPALRQCNHYLTLDISSVNVGWALRTGRTIGHIKSGTLYLPERASIGQRTASLLDWILATATQGGSQFLVYEAPVKKFYKAFVAQVRVQTAVWIAAYKLNIPVIESSPTQWKAVLVGSGSAGKPAFMVAAARWMNLVQPTVYDHELLAETNKHGEFLSYCGTPLVDEHAAAALGMARTIEYHQAIGTFKKAAPRKKLKKRIPRTPVVLSDES